MPGLRSHAGPVQETSTSGVWVQLALLCLFVGGYVCSVGRTFLEIGESALASRSLVLGAVVLVLFAFPVVPLLAIVEHGCELVRRARRTALTRD